MENKLELWEILIPCADNNGNPFAQDYHDNWTKKIRDISGGFTALSPADGQWTFKDNLLKEKMIPVRLTCNKDQIDGIADYTAKYYQQLAIFYYKVSDTVIIKHYEQ